MKQIPKSQLVVSQLTKTELKISCSTGKTLTS